MHFRQIILWAQIIACLSFLAPELEAAAPKDCRVSLLRATAQKLGRFLARHDLKPFHLGSEKPSLAELDDTVNAELTRQMDREALRLALLKAFESLENWTPLGKEMDFGTFIEAPQILQGEVIAGMSVNAAGEWSFVSGKVLRVEVAGLPEEGVFQTELSIHGLSGTTQIFLPGAAHLHRLEKTPGGRVQRALQKLKTLVENKTIEAKAYLEEIAATKGFRIVLRARDLHAEQNDMRWAGLIRKESSQHGKLYWVFHPVRSLGLATTRAVGWLRGESSWSNNQVFFTPALLHFAHHNLYQRPSSGLIAGIEWLHTKTLGPWKSEKLKAFFAQKLEFSAPVNTIAGSLLFIGAYQMADAWWTNEHLIPKRLEVIEAIQDELLFAVETDPFLSRVEYQWQAGLISDQEAAEEAFLRLDSLSIVYELMDYFPEADNAELLDFIRRESYLHSIFPATLYIDEHGPRELPGIFVPEHQHAPASDEEMMELIQVNRDLFYRRPLIQEWTIGNLDRIQTMIQARPVLAQAWRELQNDPYNQALWQFYNQQQIDAGELLYLMLENSHWQEKFARWDIFEAERYEIDEQGNRQVLSLQDFQKRRLEFLFENHMQVRALSSIDFYPVDEFNNRHLLNRLGPNLAYFYVLGSLAPLLRRFVGDPRLFKALAKGRYKNAMKSKRMNAIVLLTASGEIRRQHRGSALGVFLGLIGTALIAWDIFAHWHQAESVEPEVRSVLENPYLEPVD